MLRKLTITFMLLFIIATLGIGQLMNSNSFDKVEVGMISMPINQEYISLEGEWEFYPNKWVPFEEFKTKKPTFHKVPGLWNESNGIGTYRITIKDLEIGHMYGFKMMHVMSAYELYVDGELIGKSGTIGTNKEEEKAITRSTNHYFVAQNTEVTVVMYISNYHYRNGGIWYAPLFGQLESISQVQLYSVSFTLLTMGNILLIALYQFALYTKRKYDRVPLYLGLFCVFISFRSIFTEVENILYNFFVNFPYELAAKIGYISYFLTVPMFMFYIYHLYPEDTKLIFSKICFYISICFSVFTLLTPAMIFTKTPAYYNVVTIFGVFYSLTVFIRALSKRRVGSKIAILGATIFSIAVLNDILVWNNLINSPSLTGYGLLIFIYSQTLVTASKYAQTFNENEQMKIELEHLNSTLEHRVFVRTQQLKVLNEKLRAQSFQDGLTGISNRRYLDEVYKKLWEQAKKQKKPISVLMADIDYFKRYNDHYGHLAGDDCLRTVAQILRDSVPKKHVVLAKYGGEEFIAIVTNLNATEAADIAETMRIAVEEKKVEHKRSPIADVITISVGVATYDPFQTLVVGREDLIEKADQALYKAKTFGRNLVCVYETKKTTKNHNDIM